MTTTDKAKLREKIMFGLDLSYKNLIKSKKKQNGDLVLLRNGRIVKIKAQDL